MDISNLSIATIRSLGIDTINKANSGHPGMVLGSAPALYTLFNKELNIYNKEAEWINRDRFVLASGHASALLYSMLHLTGFDVTIDDLKNFRQLNSHTPGHPEIEMTHGVDASSGPLGQGIPMAAGMAMAEKFLASQYNKENFDIIDHYTYVLCGDGDMQEGVTYEAASLAGHLSLGKLIVLYDANKVTLDGPLSMSFSENVKKRYEACNWQVLEVKDGNDINEIHKAIKKGKKEQFKPTLIIVNTVIGFGSANQGTNKVHGAPLGKEDGKNAKLSYGFDHDEFYVPEEVYEDFKKKTIKRGKSKFNKWNKLFNEYKEQYPTEAKQLEDAIAGKYSLNIDELLKNYPVGHNDATRNTSLEVIQEVAKQNPTFLSGTADLASSTKTKIKDEDDFSVENYNGRNLVFGIREFAMVAIMNGMTLHKGVKVSAGGFLVFSDYFKAAVRMACLMKLPIILPLSHDSIAVGEDGPTHQPIEQFAMLRSIPNMHVIRPGDAVEMAAAWKLAIESTENPTALILTRQNVETMENSSVEGVSKGAYVIGKEENHLDAIIIASGSEVNLAMKAKKVLLEKGIDVRVVSMPCQEIFDQQDEQYKEAVLPNAMRKRLSVEMASSFGWHKYVGLDGITMSIDEFGKSAPAQDVIQSYGFTVDGVVENIEKLLK
ncbi:transketolase [Coprobacillus sp. AF13-15]|jgi:transketolase|uniref:Transketolase n=2 Tax=Bacteria TaxID=2 RepID=A0AAW4VM43_9FIRM|nr:transketolase [Faecalibacillus intestinalis]RGI26785.1 transketolase [Coprobacillus sp. OM08-19]RHN88258.1 transketolase [Coprobacillus sp. AM23-2]RHO35956.1 transketolase [Coprobacillus sp. AM17-34]RHR91286.1 transketolase [Coprobacillus sp. AF15-30]RHS07858.1 transketolase [Coprobacillus sp. AF13-4LB]RHS13934.1 transketolase [Coprobacillus sp. AF13-25]RHS15545.1 transketolase [Coprobacillus sp. AF13-15]RHU59502.1 transketolase [Coprobacillus sp. TF10-10]UYJ04523.1 MAG: transketolase [